MVILVVFAAVWLSARVMGALQTVICASEQSCLDRDAVGEPLVHGGRFGVQDADPAEPDRTQRGTSDPSVLGLSTRELAAALTASVWRDVTTAAGELAAVRRMPAAKLAHSADPQGLAGGPATDRVAVFRETIVDAVARPDGGPAYFGGRDDAIYLRGWDDAVDWIGRGQDAKSPRWGDIAYMTGWNHALRDVAKARRRG